MQKRCEGFLIFLLFICVLPTQGQDSVALSKQYYDMGMEIFDFMHRKQATENFILATQYNPRNPEAQFMAGKSIMLTVHKERSLLYFLSAWKLNPDIDETIIYLIGQAYQYSEMFDSAIFFFEHYNKILARSMKFQKSLKINEVNHRIFECRNAKIFMSYPVNVEITNLGYNLNSEWPDYAPTVTASDSMMVFTSRRPDDNTNPDLASDLEYYEDIYITYREGNGWGSVKNMGPPINGLYHDASINLSPDGLEMFIYNDNNGGDIYETFRQPDATWSNPTPLKGEINTEYLENSATITSDNDVLYFASDRPGGYGRMDIYMATRNRSGAWVKPVNLGPVVNTEYDEEGVFISSNGEHLYFSSNGHAGMGDLDLYRSKFNPETNEWEEPLNLGYPINSVENDVFFALTGDEHYAYMSSVKKNNKGEQDIYRIDMSKWEPVDLSMPALVNAWIREETEKAFAPPKTSIIDFEVKVVDEISLENLEARVVLISSTDRVLEPIKNSAGLFTFQFKNDSSVTHTIRITKEGYLPHISEISIILYDSVKSLIKETILLKKAVKHFTGVLNVYFGHDSDLPNTFEDIQYMELLLKKTPSLKVEISGHTDDVGPAEYNTVLSQRRADAVRNYLLEAGIAPDRVTAVGYGESNPVADNSTMQGRRLNRRTEFRILETTIPKL